MYHPDHKWCASALLSICVLRTSGYSLLETVRGSVFDEIGDEIAPDGDWLNQKRYKESLLLCCRELSCSGSRSDHLSVRYITVHEDSQACGCQDVEIDRVSFSWRVTGPVTPREVSRGLDSDQCYGGRRIHSQELMQTPDCSSLLGVTDRELLHSASFHRLFGRSVNTCETIPRPATRTSTHAAFANWRPVEPVRPSELTSTSTTTTTTTTNTAATRTIPTVTSTTTSSSSPDFDESDLKGSAVKSKARGSAAVAVSYGSDPVYNNIVVVRGRDARRDRYHQYCEGSCRDDPECCSTVYSNRRSNQVYSEMAQDFRALMNSAIEERRSRHQRAEPAHGLRPMTTPTPELIVVAAPTSSSSTTGSSTTASTSTSITATTPETNEYEGHHRKRQQHHRHHEPKPSAGQGDLGESLGYNYAFDFTFDEPEKQNEENDDPGGTNLRGKAGESGRVGRREPEKPEELPDRKHPVTDSYSGIGSLQRRRETEPYPPSEPLAGSEPSVDESPETADEELGEDLVGEEEDGVAEEDLPLTDARGESTKEAAYDVWSPHSAELAIEQTKPTNLPGRPLENNRAKPPKSNDDSPLSSIAASESDPTAETLESRPLFSGVNPTESTIPESDDDGYTETVEEVGKEDTRRTFGGEEPYSETVEEVGRPETRKTFGDRLDVKELEKLADEEPSEQEVLEAFKSAGLEEAFSTASKGEG